MEGQEIDSEVAAMLLGITTTNLRQLVYRKVLVPVGRAKRRNTFRLSDVMALRSEEHTSELQSH